MKRVHFYFICLVITSFFLSCKNNKQAQHEEKKQTVNYLEESKESLDKRMEWWRDARFGMFIHWGVYSIPAGTYKGKKIENIGEWIQFFGKIPVEEYEEYAKQFNPEKFDADAWVQLIKEAGMKYLVITSKHHDGFCLWDSEVATYDIMDFAPYKKDILKALSEACKKQGIKFGLYHSILDWHHQDAHYNGNLREKGDEKVYAERFKKYLKEYLKPQLKELVDNYDPDILWFDGEWVGEFTHEQGKELYQYVRTLKPSILINNRVDKGRQGYQGMNKGDKDYAGDFGTPEQEILKNASDLDWESCMTMNDTWGYKSYDHNWKSAKTLIHNLIDVTSKGGNYLLNVGPTSEGIIPEPSVERLQTMGNWLDTNGEAIYQTERLKNHYKQEDIRYTKKKNTNDYYAISLEKPDASLTLKYLKPKKDSDIYLLGHNKALSWKYVDGKGLVIQIPKAVLNTWTEKSYAWTFHINGTEI